MRQGALIGEGIFRKIQRVLGLADERHAVLVNRFRTVIFDFDGVDSIGQAFADEIFRVFAGRHPEIELQAVKMSARVKQMISRAKSH